MKILTAAEMREVDRLTTERAGIRSAVLMEHAGGSVAQFIRQRFPNLERRLIFILCGKGNNGGDGSRGRAATAWYGREDGSNFVR